MTPDIIYEDQFLIVCRKPAGIPTQSSRIGTPDMVSILKNHLCAADKAKHGSSARNPNPRPPYLALIHRLDQPVEGLLVFAKTPDAAKKLNQQLQSEGFGKHYRALLSAVPAVLEDTLQNYMIKDRRTNTSRICTADTPGAKQARLHYKVLQQINGCAVADITLDTGRHHQIRVQMSHIGCPIVGDRKYGTAATGMVPEGHGLFSSSTAQLQLFAYRLTFCHPVTGKHMEFTLPALDA